MQAYLDVVTGAADVVSGFDGIQPSGGANMVKVHLLRFVAEPHGPGLTLDQVREHVARG